MLLAWYPSAPCCAWGPDLVREPERELGTFACLHRQTCTNSPSLSCGHTHFPSLHYSLSLSPVLVLSLCLPSLCLIISSLRVALSGSLSLAFSPFPLASPLLVSTVPQLHLPTQSCTSPLPYSTAHTFSFIPYF